MLRVAKDNLVVTPKTPEAPKTPKAPKATSKHPQDAAIADHSAAGHPADMVGYLERYLKAPTTPRARDSDKSTTVSNASMVDQLLLRCLRGDIAFEGIDRFADN